MLIMWLSFELFWQWFECFFLSFFWCYTWHFQKSKILTCSLRNAIVGVSLVSYSSLGCHLILQLLLKLEDNRLIETVGIPVMVDKGLTRLTACVSSQVFRWFLNH